MQALLYVGGAELLGEFFRGGVDIKREGGVNYPGIMG